ncbi:MAG: ClpXP protease specificity-enhancing factor [Pseudoxanthomonas sp.]
MTEEMPRMTSHRPYLLRALSQWIADNDMTPHLLVDATVPGVQVPPSVVKEGKVVLNIAERAVVRLQIDNSSVSFSARFGGVSYPVMVPISAVLAIYARETGQGMALPDDIAGATGPEGDDEPPSPDTSSSGDAPVPGKRPSFLRVVK